MNKRSFILTLLGISMVLSFPLNEAFAVSTFTPTTQPNGGANNQILIDFGSDVATDAPGGDTAALWSISNGLTVSSVTVLPLQSAEDISSVSTLTITTNEVISTGLTPLVRWDLSEDDTFEIFDDNDTNADQTGLLPNATFVFSDDGISPVVVTAKITQPNTVTIVFSELVVFDTSLPFDNFNDLVLTAGGPRTILTITGSVTDTATITFDGAAAAVDETGTIDIEANFGDFAESNPFAGTNQAITDGNAPVLSFTSATPDNGILAVGQSVVVLLTETESAEIGLAVVAATINAVDVSASFSDNGDGTYDFTYTVSADDADIADAANLPMSVTLEDAAGNDSNVLGNITSDSAPGIDGDAPTITFTSATPSSGDLTAGQSVVVLLTETENAEIGLEVVAATINAVDVSGEFSDNGDGTYDFTYTVSANDNDIADAADLPMSITLEDAAGNDSNVLGDIASDSAPGIDGDTPTLLSVIILSDNPNVNKARINDTVTIRLDASETINAPTVTIDGNAADSVNNTVDDTWLATRTIQDGDTEGVLAFSIDFTDGVTPGTQVTTTTDSSTVTVDTTRPTISTSKITGPNEITIVFFEAVVSNPSDYTNLHLDTADEDRAVSAVEGSATSIHVLTFDGAAVSLSETATMDVGTNIRDLAFNNFTPVAGRTISDGQAPQILSAQITDGNQITLVFTESIAVSFSNFANLTFTAGGARTITSVSTSGAATVLIGFDGDPVIIDETGTIDVLPTATDSAGNSVDGVGTAITDGREISPINSPIITSPADDTTVTVDTVTLIGTSVANATIEVFDGITSLGNATADSSGDWTFTTPTLADGAHSFTATANDGTTSDPSAAVTVTIDTTVAPPPSSFTAWTQNAIDVRNSKSAAFQALFPVDTVDEINRLLAWAGNPVAQANNSGLTSNTYEHFYTSMKRWDERVDLQTVFTEASLADDMINLTIWSGNPNVLANSFNSDLLEHEATYVLLRIFLLERDDLRANPVFAGALDASDTSRLNCFAENNTADSRLQPFKAFYAANCVV